MRTYGSASGSRELGDLPLISPLKAPCFAASPARAYTEGTGDLVSQFLETNMQRKASARWQGTVKEGKGSISTQSGVLSDAPYGFNARFGDGKGTNPEELLGAAHAGCFTMALSFALNNAGFTAEAIDTEAAVTLEKVSDAWTITAIHLTTRARVPSIDAAKFAEIAGGAKANCPVSRVLNATITMDAKLGG
jgi:lipoyl-dependent peroxiredoxin